MDKRAKKSPSKSNYPVHIIWRADRDGNMTYLNGQWQEYTGFTLQESLGFNYIKAISISDRDRFLSQWQQARVKQKSTAIECNIVDLNGIDRLFIFFAEPLIRESTGEIFEWIGTFTNIENKKPAKPSIAELFQLNIILWKTIASVEKRNRELDRFCYFIAHDLKAPLRGISSIAEWLEIDLQDRLDSQSELYLKLLRDRLDRINNLINGLLDYCRLDRSAIKSELVDVNILLQEVIDSLAPPPNFQVEIVAQMPVFITERLLLERVFANLIDNAIKHHDRSHGKVEIFAVDRDSFYEFGVADDGPGISGSDRERIFIIFQTLQAKDELPNTGIGLSIVKKILTDRGDKIEVVSELGKGSIFRFTWSKNS